MKPEPPAQNPGTVTARVPSRRDDGPRPGPSGRRETDATVPALTRRSAMSALAGAVAPLSASTERRPNVLIAISDQLHHGALRCAGNEIVETPNIDRLASEGVRFENALCPTPFCSPTRASLMTGMFPHQHRVIRNLRRSRPGLNPDLETTEQALMDAGYAARQFGKWHLGAKTRVPAYARDPELNYSDYFRPIGREMPAPPEGPRNRVGRPIYSVEAVKRANANYGGDRGPANSWIGRTDVPVEHTEEAWIADRAIQAVRELAGEPFFVTVSFPAPHGPWVVNEPYYSLYERQRIRLPANRDSVLDIERRTAAWRFGSLLGEEGLREYLAVYYGMVSMMDANLGRILDELDRLGEADNTLVVFTSDHGDMQAGHGMYGKSTYSMYEETTRVPLLLRYPGRIPAGRTVRTHAGTCDISPTILDYLGVGAPDSAGGGSLRPFVDGKEQLDRPMFAERDRSNWDVETRANFQRLIRTHEWKYSYHSRGDSQLFHLAQDPGETRNLIDDRAARSARLKLHGDLVRWMKETEDPRASAMAES